MLVEELRNSVEWETFLNASPDGTLFHSLKWREVIENSFHYSAVYLLIKDDNGRTTGICPGFITGSMPIRVYSSLPHSDYGGPVIAKDYLRQASSALLEFLQDYCAGKNVQYSKFCFADHNLAQIFKSPLGHTETVKGIMEIDLRTLTSDFIWNKVFSGNRRRKINLVEKKGFQAREAITKSDLRDFYDLYRKNMEYIGASFHPFGLFEKMWSMLYPGNLRIWLLEKDKTVGGILLLKDQKRSYAVYAGLDREQRIHGPFNYLIWNEIKKAEQEGIRYISLGSTPSDPKDPHFLQKMSLGSSFHQQETVCYPLDFLGILLLQTKAKAVPTWRTIRKFLPMSLGRVLEGSVIGSLMRT